MLHAVLCQGKAACKREGADFQKGSLVPFLSPGNDAERVYLH